MAQKIQKHYSDKTRRSEEQIDKLNKRETS